MMQRTSTRASLLALLLAIAGCDSNSTANGNEDKDAGGNPPNEQDGGGNPPQEDGGSSGGVPSDMSMGGFDVDLSDPSAKYTGVLEVTQADGTPAAAMLTVGSKSYAADSNGKITIADLPASKTLNGVIKSEGFLARGVKLSFAAVGQGAKRIVLEQVAVLRTINAGAGGVVDATTTQVSFPPNAFLDGDGKVFDGKVIVSAAAQDPASIALSDYENGESFEVRSDFDFDRVPDGYLFAEQADGSISFQYPESVFSIDIADESGNALTINPSATASFRMRLPAITQRLPGDVVSVYTFDESALRWVVDGTCTVTAAAGGGLDCVGEAKHFSARSIPVNAEGRASCFEYRVERKNFPAGVKVKQWSLSQAGTSTFRAEINELNSHGMCHVSAQGKGRVVMEITSGSETRLFESAWDESIPTIKFGAADITALNEQHECPACVVRVVVADWNALAPATDADGDGFFVGAGVNVPDCDDKDATVYPGAVETVCDAKDRNCDKTVPPGWSMKTRAEAAASGVTAAVWNGTLCGLSCIVPDQREERATRPEWDDNCDGSLNCPAGTELVEGVCQPFKTCQQVTCSEHASCAEGEMGAVCTCQSGFVGDGITCMDMNECLDNNGDCGATAAWHCENVIGSRTCTDINECDTDNGGCEVGCSNSTGSFTCTCAEGEALNEDGKNCDTITACTGNPCDAEGDTTSACSVETVGYSCACSDGYEVTGTATPVCSDINGCDGQAIEACLGESNCVDEPAPGISYACDCGPGYLPVEGGMACSDFDACDLPSDPCQDGGDTEAFCSDDQAPGTGYSCVCSEGYVSNGNTCSMPATCGSCGEPGCCQNPECFNDPMCMTSSCFNDCSAPGCCQASECLGNPVCGGGGTCIFDAICDPLCPGGDPDCPGGGGGCIPGMPGCII